MVPRNEGGLAMDMEEVTKSFIESILKSVLLGMRDWIKEEGPQAFEGLIQHYFHISLD